MSAICGMKFEIMEARKKNQPFFSRTPIDTPQSRIIKDCFRVKAREIEDIGFQSIQKEKQKKRKRKRKQQRTEEEENDRYQYDVRVRKNLLENEFCDDSGSEKEENDDDDNGKKKNENKDHEKVAWDGPDLTKAARVTDLDEIIKSLKEVNVLFDHGETPTGIKSDENFYKWLEEYCRLRHVTKKVEDDAIFYKAT